MGVQNHMDALCEISGKATAEKSLEDQLAALRRLWAEDMELSLVAYKQDQTKMDLWILGDLETVVTALEDSLVSVASIAGSRFVAPIRDEVDEWQRNLLLLQETLDEWMLLQKQWMYLESIFSASDIRKQLPSEAAKFAEVDSHWQKMMKESSEENLAIVAGTKAGRLQQMRRCNQVLDGIQKSLEDYLQSKRLHFARFFFLSNEELLEILAHARRLDAVQPHLRKCFENVNRLNYATPDRNSVELLSMVSGEGEEMAFWKPLKARGNVERWLPEMEE